jgi:endonuclease G, mitochondrial
MAKVERKVMRLIGFFSGILLFTFPALVFAVDFPKLEIHSDHFIGGYPAGMSKSNDLVIRRGYALSNNDSKKFADWVAYKLTPVEVWGTLDLERKWRADPFLSNSETLEPSPNDYKNASSKDYDRGHQAPLASFKGSLHASDVNYFSNITPQKKNLNQGPWKRLEEEVRGFVKKGNVIWVMTGPLYETSPAMEKLPNADEPHTVPSGYWKLICKRDGNTIKVSAFIMKQDSGRNDTLSSKLTTVQKVEERSKLEFFWDLKPGDSVNKTALDNFLGVN